MQEERVSFLRASGWVGPDQLKDTLTIIGCGAVGSNVALCAAKMGWARFELYDMDHVEPHNLPNQAYFPKHIGRPKVDALADLLTEFNSNIRVTPHNKPFTSDLRSTLDGVLVIATDSMSSRYDITKAFAYNTKVKRVYEARLGFSYGEAHILDPSNRVHVEAWKKSLKDDSEIPDGPCNLRICATLVGVVSSTLAHYTCVPYAERRNGKDWDYPFFTRFVLDDTLRVWNVQYQVTEDLQLEEIGEERNA